MVKILSSMIESKFAFLQMQVEGSFVNSTESKQPSFGKTPEALNPVHVDAASNKFILPMIDSKMLPIAHVDQTVIATPPIRIDYTVQGDLAANNRLQRGFSAVGNKFRVDLSVALENAKDDGFPIRPAASLPFNTARPKVGLINFDLASERRLSFTEFGNPLAKSPYISVDRIAIQPSQKGHL